MTTIALIGKGLLLVACCLLYRWLTKPFRGMYR